MSAKNKKLIVLIFLFLIVVPNIFVSLSTSRSRGGDFRGFLIAGDRLIKGQFLYEDSRVATNVTWPPFFAVFIVPFVLLARLNLPITQMIWYLLNISLFFAAVHIWCRLTFDKPLGWFDEKKELSFYSTSVIVPILLVSEPLLRNFVPLQINPLMLFVMSIGFLLLKENRLYQSGFWFGLAAAIKAFPIVILAYLVFRKKIKAAFAMGLTIVVLTLSPMLRYGWTTYWELIKTWLHLSASGGYPLGSLNQSAYAMITRWIASNPFILMKQKLSHPPLDAPEVLLSVWIYRILFLLLLSAFLFILHRKKTGSVAFEGAYLIVLCMTFSPIAWRSYWMMVFPAYFVLFHVMSLHRNSWLKYTFWGSAVLISGLSLFGRILKIVMSFSNCVLSNMTMGALLLLGSLLVLIAHQDETRPISPIPLQSKDNPR